MPMPLLPAAVLLALLGFSLGAQHFLAQPSDTTASRGETVSTGTRGLLMSRLYRLIRGMT